MDQLTYTSPTRTDSVEGKTGGVRRIRYRNNRQSAAEAQFSAVRSAQQKPASPEAQQQENHGS
jgi:hypothetical protein